MFELATVSPIMLLFYVTMQRPTANAPTRISFTKIHFIYEIYQQSILAQHVQAIVTLRFKLLWPVISDVTEEVGSPVGNRSSETSNVNW